MSQVNNKKYPDTAKGNRSAREAAAKEMSYTIAQKSRLAKERGKSQGSQKPQGRQGSACRGGPL